MAGRALTREEIVMQRYEYKVITIHDEYANQRWLFTIDEDRVHKQKIALTPYLNKLGMLAGR